MGVANHLRIQLNEYDARIRTFVQHYETMQEVASGALQLVSTATPTVVDLGVGTGALTAACLQVRPHAHVIGLDADPGMLEGAKARLGPAGTAVELRQADFVVAPLPAADAMVACLSLHHILDATVKKAFYRRVFEALRPGGLLVSGDCFPAAQPDLAARHREAWLAHMQRTYTRAEAEAYLQSWSHEDVYFPLELELGWLRDAGFATEVLWRSGGFAVVAGFRQE